MIKMRREKGKNRFNAAKKQGRKKGFRKKRGDLLRLQLKVPKNEKDQIMKGKMRIKEKNYFCLLYI